MSNAARHAVGAAIGVVATPLIFLGLLYGVRKMGDAVRRLQATFTEAGGERWIGALVLLALAILLAVTVAPRISPMASLLPGVLLTGVGALWVVDPAWAVRNSAPDAFPDDLVMPYMTLAPYGMFLLLGLLLLAASAMPGRWTTRRNAFWTDDAAPRPAPMGPSAPAGPPPAPLGPPQAPSGPPPAGAPRMASAPPPPAQPGHPGRPDLGGPYADPPYPEPPQPQTPPSGTGPFGREQRRSGQGEAGEWTSMYGEDDLRGDGR